MKEWQRREYWCYTALRESVALIRWHWPCGYWDIPSCGRRRRLSDAVLKSITWGWSQEGSVEVVHRVRLPVLCRQGWLLTRRLRTLPFPRIWSEALSEPLGYETFLSAIHVGNGNSKCSSLTPQPPPSPPLLQFRTPCPLSRGEARLLISTESWHLVVPRPHAQG